jgi:membrane-associated phospholipid phosphatase
MLSSPAGTRSTGKWSLRPITAIRRLIDPSWSSYIVTPPFPSYTSGHSTTSGAASTVLAAFCPAKAAELAAIAEEAALSRLYGGIHFRSDKEVGLAVGRRVGGVALRAYHISGG